ncbi:MAG: deoxycytidylate deaminase [Nitrospirales bacterium]|nr:MAG: deoxycytidylate deaminase [Nitrospirales bacterium]
MLTSDSTAPVSGTELFIGLVAAVGTNQDLIVEEISKALKVLQFESQEIRLIHLLRSTQKTEWQKITDSPIEKRYHDNMDAGNAMREMTGRGDALSLLGITEVLNIRNNPSLKDKNIAYIFRSLKHPDEVKTFRKIYGPSFILISAYAPREIRHENLARKIADSHGYLDPNPYYTESSNLIFRDECEMDKKLGQNLRDTFPMADVFIDVGSHGFLTSSIKRFVELLFGNTFHTPTRDEYGMFHAQAAALRSSSLGRQVGAAISNESGDIIAVGTNEVPKPGGGLYWAEDTPDHRDHTLGEDPSDKMKMNVFVELVKRLKESHWLADELAKKDPQELALEALAPGSTFSLKNTQLMNIIEFGRAVHAEMAALLDAACRGVSVKNCTLYTTTFPCHDCAKHIVAAGIKRVLYIEPYPKSLAVGLYPDSISVDKPEDNTSRVKFEPFVGLAPRRYMELFEMLDRKKGGKVIEWGGLSPQPRLPSDPNSYTLNEVRGCETIRGKMIECDLISA